jgi:uncharacterized metal-binding protein YceD (DUF177 family)
MRAAVLRATAAHRRDTSVVGECFDGAALRIECEINAAVVGECVRCGAERWKMKHAAKRASFVSARRTADAARWSDVPFQGLAPE